MLECCQGSSPTGKLCKDCPRAKPKPLDDMSPEAIGRRLRESNLRGDEPFPGYSGGKKIEQPAPPPPPAEDDDPTDQFFNTMMKNFADMMGLTYEECERLLSTPFTGGVVGKSGEVFRIGEGVFHTGGVYAPGSVAIPFDPKTREDVDYYAPHVVVNYVPDVAYIEANEETLKVVRQRIADSIGLPGYFLDSKGRRL